MATGEELDLQPSWDQSQLLPPPPEQSAYF